MRRRSGRDERRGRERAVRRHRRDGRRGHDGRDAGLAAFLAGNIPMDVFTHKKNNLHTKQIQLFRTKIKLIFVCFRCKAT